MVCENSKEDVFSLSCDAISFLKKTVSKKQDLLSEKSLREDRLIYEKVVELENRVKKNQVSLPVNLCLFCFQKLNKDYAERNVACTGIGRLGCFLIDYIFTHRDLKRATDDLYGQKGNRGVYRQYEWYNHAIASMLDVASQKRKKQIAKNQILNLQNECKRDYTS